MLQWKPLNLIMLNSLKERLGLLKRPDERRMDNILGELAREDAAESTTNGDEEEEEEEEEEEDEEQAERSERGIKGSHSFLSSPGSALTTTTTTTDPSMPIPLKVGSSNGFSGITRHHNPQQQQQHHPQHQHHHPHQKHRDEEEEAEEEARTDLAVANLLAQGNQPSASAYLQSSPGGQAAQQPMRHVTHQQPQQPQHTSASYS